MFNDGAGVHHDVQPGQLGPGRGSLIDDAQLQPDCGSTNGNGLVDNGPDFLGIHEAIHHVNVSRNFPKGFVSGRPQNAIATQ